MLLVDTSHPESLGHYLYQSFTYHQEKPSSSLIKKLLLRSVLHSAPPDTSIDLTDLDRKISVSANTHTLKKSLVKCMNMTTYIYCLLVLRLIMHVHYRVCVYLKFKGSMSTMSEGGTGAPLLILCFSNDSLLYQYYYFLHSLYHYQQ